MILSNLPAYMPGLARAYFFVTETSTPSTVYQDADGLDAHTNPVLASAAGILPAIFLDPAVTYRVVYTGEDGDLTNPLWEADPVTAPSIGVSTFNTRFGNVTLNTGDIEDALGYTPGTDEPASDTSAGLIEIATDAETQAGVDATKAVTPAGLASMVPTDTTRGLVEIATSTEIKAGTDDERAITPAGLKAIAFRSGEISLTVGGAGTVSHGLSQQPAIIGAILVCKTGQLGYTAGDEVMAGYSDGQDNGITIRATSGSVSYRIGQAVTVTDDTGQNTAITLSNWRLVLTAFAFPN